MLITHYKDTLTLAISKEICYYIYRSALVLIAQYLNQTRKGEKVSEERTDSHIRRYDNYDSEDGVQDLPKSASSLFGNFASKKYYF